MIYAQNPHVYGWGSHQNARRITRRSLTRAERDAIAAGLEVRVGGCPAHRGSTERRVICVNGNYFCRTIAP